MEISRKCKLRRCRNDVSVNSFSFCTKILLEKYILQQSSAETAHNNEFSGSAHLQWYHNIAR